MSKSCLPSEWNATERRCVSFDAGGGKELIWVEHLQITFLATFATEPRVISRQVFSVTGVKSGFRTRSQTSQKTKRPMYTQSKQISGNLAWYSWSFNSIPVRELSFKQRTRKLPPQFDFIAFPLFLPLPQKVWERHWNRPWNLNFLEKSFSIVKSTESPTPSVTPLHSKGAGLNFFVFDDFDQKKTTKHQSSQQSWDWLDLTALSLRNPPQKKQKSSSFLRRVSQLLKR